MASGKFPLWLRFFLMVVTLALAAGVGLFGYRYWTHPVTFTVAVGSIDGEAAKALSAIASRFVSNNDPVRFKVVEVSAGKVDLAVVRGDVGDLSKAGAVVIVARVVALIVAPPGSSIDSLATLKGRSVGVIGGEVNSKLVDILSKEYGLNRAKAFKDVTLADARRALQSKEIGALLVVIPLSEKYLSLVRGFFQQGPKSLPVLVGIDSAGAIAEAERAYESFDVPKGTLRGNPPVPDDDLTTLRTALYLVANKKLSSDSVATLTKTIMSVRRDLMVEQAAFYNGTTQSFMDEYGNWIYLTPMILGGIATALAGAWKFLGIGESESEAPLDALYALSRRIRKADTETELSDIEDEIDRILAAQRAKAAAGDETAVDATTLNVAAHRLENLIHDRRTLLAGKPVAASVS